MRLNKETEIEWRYRKDKGIDGDKQPPSPSPLPLPLLVNFNNVRQELEAKQREARVRYANNSLLVAIASSVQAFQVSMCVQAHFWRGADRGLDEGGGWGG